jgi:putative membrane-bound dehydrogenase-like protein
MTSPDDLEIDLVLSEPEIAQPVFFNFDERGRMWVVEYLQYPVPAGLKIVSRDKHWRVVYDKIPAAPGQPGFVPGRDRITIHEDTNGDGKFDSHKVFIEGLSIVTSLARGRGGVWVLNPPYLLFYADKDNDDRPDGKPEVHLSGFGLEDTHSNTNSLRWGPDGWLYASQGSTVSGRVIRPGIDKKPVFSQGQLIWRYHPERRRYEIFAEGGGNAFGVEIDSKGRIFSGHNGGNTRGFHYVQGAYLRKGFSKHGPLSNPYAFGYFEHMPHHQVKRFTHNFVIYEGGALPEKYNGNLFGIDPMNRNVPIAEFAPDGASFRTKDIAHAMTTTDSWIRPVDIKIGPDGAIYFADFYEEHPSHRQHYEGKIGRDTGRIYRIRAKGSKPIPLFDLGTKSSTELVELLRHKNRWFRQTALRLLGDAKDEKLAEQLAKAVDDGDDQLSLEAFWAYRLGGGRLLPKTSRWLENKNPHIRAWTVHFLGDEETLSDSIADDLAKLASNEPNVEVRCQLACTAKRLASRHSMPIVANLLRRDEDAGDRYLPLLLWWAIESKCANESAAVIEMLSDAEIWSKKLVRDHIVERVMRRFAATGSRRDLLVCAKLLRIAPDEESSRRLMSGFELAYKGRPLTRLPEELLAGIAKAGGASLPLRVRQLETDAVAEALKLIADDRADAAKRQELIEIFGQVRHAPSLPVLLNLVTTSKNGSLQKSALVALQSHPDDAIAAKVLAQISKLPAEVRDTAFTLLCSRKSWADQTVKAGGNGLLDPKSVPDHIVGRLVLHGDEHYAATVIKTFGRRSGLTTEQMKSRISKVAAIVASGNGDPYQGKPLFTNSCGKCHVLHAEGGQIGPDLTAYKRDDLDSMLLHIINPSAEIREGFEAFIAYTDDGRTATGFMADQDEKVVVLRGIDGQNISLRRDQLDEIAPLGRSIMPEKLLAELSDQQIRDLFAYLRSGQPLNN